MVVVAVGSGWWAQDHRVLYDLTAEDTLTLTDHTRSVVDALAEPVELTAVLRRSDPARVEALALLDRYRRLDRRITIRAVDPDDAPGEVRRLGVEPVFGGVAAEADSGQVEVAPTPTEQDITAALGRLVRGGAGATVCFDTAHGEPSVTSRLGDGLSSLSELLAGNGHTVDEVGLLGGRPVPARCDALVLAGVSAPLGRAAAVLEDWVADDGRLLVLADPPMEDGLDPGTHDALSSMLGSVGLGLQPGLVLEGDAASTFPGDPTAPIVRTFAAAHPVTRRVPPVFFPGVQGIEVDDEEGSGGGDDAAGRVLTRLADTSELAYLETDPTGAASFSEADDEAGPVTVAAAAEVTELGADQVARRTRVVVVGDADFASNAFLAEAGNATLVARAVDWLTLDEELVVIDTHLARDRPLQLTAGRVRYLHVLYLGLVPGLFLVAGGLVWSVRRSR